MNDYASFRAEKDEFFRVHPQSPIPHHDRRDFAGLAYYEPNEALNLELEPTVADGDTIRVQTSDGQIREYHRAATVEVPIGDETVRLTLLSQPGRPGYFLPFRDSTSGKATYGAGRYLDLEDARDGLIHIDFNLAYNPYCAYDDAYSCPLPPHENWPQFSSRPARRIARPEAEGRRPEQVVGPPLGGKVPGGAAHRAPSLGGRR